MSKRRGKKVLVVTWSLSPNYGTVLQAYGLTRTLSKFGYDPRILDRFDPDFSFPYIIDSLFRVMNIRKFWKTAPPAPSAKMLKIQEFHRNHFKRQHVVMRRDLKSLGMHSAAFISGSDQLWNCSYNFDPFYFLDFAPSSKKISYASSIGTASIPEEYTDRVKSLLKDFKRISVRESSAVKVLSDLTGRTDISHVLDPTLLLEAGEWESLLSSNPSDRLQLPHKYALCYFLKSGGYPEYALEDVKDAYGLKDVILVPSAESPSVSIQGAKRIDDAGIEDFIHLVSNASVVCTDSFHGCAMAIDFSKPIVAFKRHEDESKESQNSRLYDLFSTLGMEGRFYDPEDGRWRSCPDYQRIHCLLSSLRDDSLTYLHNALTM